MEHRFTLILKDTHGVIDDLSGDALMDMADALFEAGCDDSTSAKSRGVLYVHFDREGPTIRDAIMSAIRDVQRAGYRVDHVEHEEQRVFDEINAQLASGAVVTT